MSREFSRSQRVAHQIQRELAMYLEKYRPDGGGLLTISSASVSPDLKYARVYISLLGGEASAEPLLQQLNADCAQYQKHLAGALKLRVTPKLHFEYDKSLERANRITDLIDNLDDHND